MTDYRLPITDYGSNRYPLHPRPKLKASLFKVAVKGKGTMQIVLAHQNKSWRNP